jgi:hypothetical protein
MTEPGRSNVVFKLRRSGVKCILIELRMRSDNTEISKAQKWSKSNTRQTGGPSAQSGPDDYKRDRKNRVPKIEEKLVSQCFLHCLVNTQKQARHVSLCAPIVNHGLFRQCIVGKH